MPILWVRQTLGAAVVLIIKRHHVLMGKTLGLATGFVSMNEFARILAEGLTFRSIYPISFAQGEIGIEQKVTYKQAENAQEFGPVLGRLLEELYVSNNIFLARRE